MISPNEFKQLITFYDTNSVAVMAEIGGTKEQLTNRRQEYGALFALKPIQVVGYVSDVIRDSTHVLTTRFRSDLNYFTTVTRDIFDPDFTVRTETFKVNDIQIEGQENRYIVCHLSQQTTSADISSQIPSVVSFDGDPVSNADENTVIFGSEAS